MLPLNRYNKMEATQLGWRMKIVLRCPKFPLGVKTMYRAHNSDHNYEIVVDEDAVNLLGYVGVHLPDALLPDIPTDTLPFPSVPGMSF